MNTATIIFLYLYAAMEAVGVLAGITEAKKPRAEVEPAGGCLGAGALMICAAAPALLLIGDYGHTVKYLAAWLALSLVYDLAQFVRQVHGVRGPRTPVSTMAHTLWGLANLTVIAFILIRGSL